MSLVLIFRCATGENWNIIMRELAINNKTIKDYWHTDTYFKFIQNNLDANNEFKCNEPQMHL
jgi:hypothetical protein